jgi:hypothetical protein
MNLDGAYACEASFPSQVMKPLVSTGEWRWSDAIANEVKMKNKFELRITGGSDGLIEVDGCLEAEFEAGEDHDFLAISDGTLLEVIYDEIDIWRILPIFIGAGTDYTKTDGMISEDTNNKVVLTSDTKFKWVALSVDYSK